MKDIGRTDTMAKSTMKRAPKGTGHYYMTSTGKYAWRKRIDGHDKHLSADTPKELQQLINEVIDLKVIRSKLTVEGLFTKWLAYVKELRKPATYNQYNDLYRKHIKPEIGSRKISTIKPSDIQEVIFKMNKIGLSTWTMKHARKVMNGAFEYAYRREKVIPCNPVRNIDYKIDVPQKNAKPRKTLNSNELSRLFRQLKKSRWIWSAKFMLLTAMRRGELLALKWSDVDFINNRITVDESDSQTGLGDTKTKIHYIPLSKMMKAYLAGQKNMLIAESNPVLYNEELKQSDLVFPNKYGLMLNPGSYYTMIARAAEKAGIHASPHMLRHTFVYMNRKKLSLRELQDILGHDESTTTLDIYGDMIDESTEATARQIDETFAELEESINKDSQNAKVINLFEKRKAK
jgi:integrase